MNKEILDKINETINKSLANSNFSGLYGCTNCWGLTFFFKMVNSSLSTILTLSLVIT